MSEIPSTRKLLEDEFARAIRAETILTDGEKTALLNRYVDLQDAVETGMGDVEVMMMLARISGSLEFLKDCGKILEDEELWELAHAIAGGET